MKKYLILLFLLLSACNKKELTLNEKFFKNNYKNYEGDYLKNLNETDYYLFSLTDKVKSFSYELLGTPKYYFFQNNWAYINECSYNFNDNTKDNCSEEEINELLKLKEIFNNELKKLKITKNELLGHDQND